MEKIKDILNHRILVLDGAMGTMVQSYDLNESDFDWKKKQNDYENWDSFSQLNLITMLEEKFSISISDMDSISIRSAEDALNFVKNKK